MVWISQSVSLSFSPFFCSLPIWICVVGTRNCTQHLTNVKYVVDVLERLEDSLNFSGTLQINFYSIQFNLVESQIFKKISSWINRNTIWQIRDRLDSLAEGSYGCLLSCMWLLAVRVHPVKARSHAGVGCLTWSGH